MIDFVMRLKFVAIAPGMTPRFGMGRPRGVAFSPRRFPAR